MKKLNHMSRAERHALRLELRAAASKVHAEASLVRKAIRDHEARLTKIEQRRRDIFASLDALDELDE